MPPQRVGPRATRELRPQAKPRVHSQIRPDVPGDAVAFQPLPGGVWDGLTAHGFRVGAQAVDVRVESGDVRVLGS